MKSIIFIIIFCSLLITGCGFHNDYTTFTNVTYSICQVSCADIGQHNRCLSESISYNPDTMICDCVMFECLTGCEECK